MATTQIASLYQAGPPVIAKHQWHNAVLCAMRPKLYRFRSERLSCSLDNLTSMCNLAGLHICMWGTADTGAANSVNMVSGASKFNIPFQLP
jgi:hypothetical protein